MALDTIDSLIGRVQKHTGMHPDYFLVRDWVTDSYRDLVNRIAWTWRRKKGQFTFYASYTTGTVSINRGENLATFSGGAVITPDMVGRQIRIAGNTYQIRTIQGFVDSSNVYLDEVWGDISVAAGGYEIYQAYVTVPDDFDSFVSVVDLRRNFQLDWWSHTAEELDRTDPQRSYSGSIAYWMVLRDYSLARQGYVSPIVQAAGSGNKPLSYGSYDGAADATFTITITGLAGDLFQWKKDNSASSSDVVITTGNPQPLQDGVQVMFPSGVTYTFGDIFTFRAYAQSSPGNPRYEPWPHIKTDESRPFLYLAKLPDLVDSGVVIPRYVRGDVLVQMALARWAMWPGTVDKPNPAYNARLSLSSMHAANAESMVLDMEREDQARETTDLTYDSWTNLPVYDSGYLAGHDIGYELNTLDY